MKTATEALALFLSVTFAAPLHADDDKQFHDASYLSFEKPIPGPTGKNAEVIKNHAVPIYIGLPERSYKILGRIYDARRSGLGVMTKAFAEGLFSEKDRQRDCAAQAQYRGADAVVVTGDENLIKELGLAREEVNKTAPLFDHKDKVVLAVKFE